MRNESRRGNIAVIFVFFLAMVGGFLVFFSFSASPSPRRVVVSAKKSMAQTSVPSSINANRWFPQLNYTYPKLNLYDQTGNLVRLESFYGKVILIQPIAMSNPACQSYCGAEKYGGFQGLPAESGIQSIEDQMLLYADGAQLSDVVYIQLLLYDLDMSAPTSKEARLWAEHFKMDRSKNQIVLAASSSMLGKGSFKKIPGFQLVDRNFLLRADSTGQEPKHSLNNELLPMIPKLLKERRILDKDISIHEAYKKVPSKHAITPFRSNKSKVSAQERDYLKELFRLTDLALVQRVQTLDWFQKNGRSGENFNYYNRKTSAILKELRALNPPTKLQQPHQLIVDAIEEQKEFFSVWDKAIKTRQSFKYNVFPGSPIHSLVRSSSSKLKRAYGIMMKVLAKEGTHNKKAFFSHLCFLDFI